MPTPTSDFTRLLRRGALLGLLAAACSPALAIYKCEADGRTAYSDTPCPGGQVLGIAPAPSAADLVRSEKQAARDRARIKQSENEKRKLEAQEEKERQRAAHVAAAHRKRCSLLERRKSYAEEDAASAKGKSVARAKLRARRVEEKFEEECGAQHSGLIAG